MKFKIITFVLLLAITALGVAIVRQHTKPKLQLTKPVENSEEKTEVPQKITPPVKIQPPKKEPFVLEVKYGHVVEMPQKR